MIASRTPISRSEYWGLAGLAVIVLSGVLLRAFALDSWSLSDDEWYTYDHALRIGEVAYSKLQPSIRSYPAIYFLTHLSLAWFDDIELAVRFFPCILGIASLPLFFMIASRMGGRSGAFLAILILILSPWHIYYSQMARFYTGAFLFDMLALFFLYRGIWKPSLGSVWAGASFLALAVLFHPSSAFLLLGFILYFFLARRSGHGLKRPDWRLFLPVVILLGAGILGVALNYQALENTVIHGLSENPEWAYSSLDFLKRSVYYFGIHWSLLAAFGIFVLWRRNAPCASYLLILVAVAGVSLTVMAATGISVGPRYLFPLTSPLFLLAGQGGVFLLKGLWERSRPGFAAALVVLLIPGLPSLFSYYQDGNRFDFNEAAEYLGARYERGDKIFSYSHAILSHYLSLNQGAGEADILGGWNNIEANLDLTGEELERHIDAASRVWVVVPKSRLDGTGFYAEDFKNFVGQACTLEKVIQRPRYDYTRNELMIYLSSGEKRGR